MPERITALSVNRVALVPAGDNPAAEIVMWKSAPETQWETFYKRTFSAEQRKKLASSGAAMKDGSFPIENAEDLANAVQAFGRASNKPAVKTHIIKRARALGLAKNLPEGWMAKTTKDARLTPSRIQRLLGIKDDITSLLDETGVPRKEDQVPDNEAVKELLDELPEDKRGDVLKVIDEVTKESRERAETAEAELKKAQDDADKDPEPDPAEDLAKALAEMPEPVRKAFEEQRSQTADALKQAKDATEALAKAEDDRVLAESIATAKEFKNLPVKPDELGPKLAKIRKADPELADEVEATLRSTNATASEILREIGKGSGEGDSEPEQKLKALAKTIAERDGITEAAGLVKAMDTEEGKSLHAEAEQEKEANAR